MKDYSLDKETRKKFIKKYTITDEKTTTPKNIVIHYANRKKHKIPYSAEKELEIIKKIDDQTKMIENSQHEISMKKSIRNTLFITLEIVAAAIILNIPNISIPNYIITSLLLISGVILDLAEVSKIIRSNIIKKDMEKTQFFKENEEEITKGINNKNVINNVNEKTKQIIKDQKEETNIPVININTIDSMSLKDLKELKRVINLESNYSNEETTKNKTRARNY